MTTWRNRHIGYQFRQLPEGYPEETCPWCSQTFKPGQKGQIYCTTGHERAHRNAKKLAKAREQRERRTRGGKQIEGLPRVLAANKRRGR